MPSLDVLGLYMAIYDFWSCYKVFEIFVGLLKQVPSTSSYTSLEWCRGPWYGISGLWYSIQTCHYQLVVEHFDATQYVSDIQ